MVFARAGMAGVAAGKTAARAFQWRSLEKQTEAKA